MSKSIVTVWSDIDHINIRISHNDLLALAERHPDNPLKVVKISQFLSEYKQQLENYSESNDIEEGCCHLEWLVEECIQQVYENGSNSVEEIN